MKRSIAVPAAVLIALTAFGCDTSQLDRPLTSPPPAGPRALTAPAQSILDQSMTTATNAGAAINECCGFIAQTYTAGVTGTLAGAVVDVFSSSSFPLHVAIRTVAGGVPTNTVLGEVTLSSSRSGLSEVIVFPQTIPQFAGGQYAIVVNYEGAPTPGAGQGQGEWAGATGNGYAGGVLAASFDGNGSWFVPSQDIDLHFQTFVVPAIQLPSATFVAAPDLNAAVLTSTVIEGTSIKLALTNPAPAGASFQYSFDCGSGYGAFTAKNTAACPTVDNEQRAVRGQIRDDAGATEYTAAVSVVNQKPHVVLAAPEATVNLGSPLAVTGSFSDPGVQDMPWTYSIAWGDGSLTSGVTMTQSSLIAASHAYASLGTFTIKLTVTDKDGGTGKSNSVSVQVIAAVSGNTWSTVAPLPTPRNYLAAGAVNGVLYAVGGSDNFFNSFGTMEAYDPVANMWTAKAQLPTPRIGLAAGVVNGILYAVGGVDHNNQALATVEAYDPVVNTWTPKARLPTPRGFLAAGVVNGIFYAVGGANQNGPSNAVEAYDPATNTWTTKAPLPTPRLVLAVGVVNGILYAVGGSGNGTLGSVDAYDPATNTWTTRAARPTPRGYLAAGVINGLLYAVGGVADQNGLAVNVGTVEAYDPTTNTWTAKTPLPTPRGYLAAGVVNGGLYAVSGTACCGLGLVGTVEAYHP